MAEKNSYKGLISTQRSDCHHQDYYPRPSQRVATPASSELGKSSETSGTETPVTVQLSVYFSAGILAVLSVNGHENISLLR